jgi:hypothetical protein
MKTSTFYPKITFLLFLLVVTIISPAQLVLNNTDAPEKLSAKEFTIPTAPLFDLMGVAPSLVARSADIKDFKVDWSFKSWKLNPNLAIQAQPIWEAFYNRKSITKYQNASKFSRTLASMDLSIGTVQNENNDRRIGGAIKLNLYKQHDPLLVKKGFEAIEKTFAEELKELKENEKKLNYFLDSITDQREVKKLQEALKENDQKRTSFYARRNQAIQEKAKDFISKKWNSSYIDAAFGKVYTYNTDSVGSLRKLQLNRNTGAGAWLNYGFGLGKRVLLSGLVRTTFYQEALNFKLTDSTGTETDATAIAENRLFTAGINLRYGGPTYNFFIEFIAEGKTLKTPLEALNAAFTAPAGKTIASSSVKWDIVNPYVISFGGDWRVSRNVILNYGIRCELDSKFKTRSILPIANISCMMR